MISKLISVIVFATISLSAISAMACAQKDEYKWELVTAAAEFPTGYNYPVFVRGRKMFAVRDTSWFSPDGKNWRKGELPFSGLSSALQKYVQFNDAVYALGTQTGTIKRMKLSSRIARTVNGRTWEVLAEESNLPKRVFYGATVFKGKIWIFGGTYESTDFDDVWSSSDGVNWQQAAEKMPWGKRSGLHAVVLNGRIFLIGESDVWSSDNGVDWRIETRRMAEQRVFVGAYSVAVFDGKIWLVGINRNNTFGSGVLCSADGKTWREMQAPWSPRGAVAVWVADGKLFMTGGKYSYVDGRGETKFVYSNDVWVMSKQPDREM